MILPISRGCTVEPIAHIQLVEYTILFSFFAGRIALTGPISKENLWIVAITAVKSGSNCYG